MWIQKTISLSAKPRGIHLVTDEVIDQLPELQDIGIGMAHFFLQHTSASLSINENADATVLSDMEAHLNQMVPENAPYYRHTLEGSDDMPAHIKSALLGCSVSIPISQGRLCLGTWQGLYLGEHRNRGGSRRILVTVSGEQLSRTQHP